MKKFMKYLMLVFALFMVIPTSVNAEEVKEPVKIYFFRGDGCSHCAAAEAYFKTLATSDFKDMYELIDYEVWNNKNNESLMNSVASLLGAEVSGVPFIVIGQKYFNGFEDSVAVGIEAAIRTEYSNTNRYDVIAEIEKNKNNPVGLVVIGGVALGLVGLIVLSRRNNKED